MKISTSCNSIIYDHRMHGCSDKPEECRSFCCSRSRVGGES